MRIINKNNVWIINNLKVYHNCLIPRKLIKQYGVAPIEKELEKFLNKKVVIEHRIIKYDTDTFNCANNKRRVIKEKMDIAYVVE